MLLPGRKKMEVTRMNAQRFAQLVQLLMAEPQTILELSEATGLARNVVNHYIAELHGARPKLVRLAEWQQSPRARSRMWVAAYAWGSGPDARKPPKLSNAERTRRYKERQKMRRLDALLAGVGREAGLLGGVDEGV